MAAARRVKGEGGAPADMPEVYDDGVALLLLALWLTQVKEGDPTILAGGEKGVRAARKEGELRAELAARDEVFRLFRLEVDPAHLTVERARDNLPVASLGTKHAEKMLRRWPVMGAGGELRLVQTVARPDANAAIVRAGEQQPPVGAPMRRVYAAAVFVERRNLLKL